MDVLVSRQGQSATGVAPLDAELVADLEAVGYEEDESVDGTDSRDGVAMLPHVAEHDHSGDPIVLGDPPGWTPVVEELGGDGDLVADVDIEKFAVGLGRRYVLHEYSFKERCCRIASS